MSPRSRMRPIRAVAAAALAIALAVPAAATAATPDFPLKGWWPLNEGRGQTINDRSGNRNNGYLGSTTGVDDNDPSWIKGIFFGSALRFAGDDFVTIPATSNSLEPKQLTVSAWVRASSSPGTFKYILAKGGNACVSASYALSTSYNGGLIFYTWVDGAQRNAGPVAPSAIWDGRWHHVAGTWDGAHARLYVDGVLTEGDTFHNDIDYNVPAPNTIIGGYHAGCDLLFTGDIDEVHVWSQALDLSAIWKKWGWLLGIPGQQ
jgi:hypothetical protein